MNKALVHRSFSVGGWIRWKYAAPLLIFIAALLVFFILFFDPLLARGIQKFGGKANGAKVDMSGLKTKFLTGRLSIANLQVADPDSPMNNRLEAGPLVFQLSLSDLFSRRVIINEATLSGLAFNTPRKTSGVLPKIQVKKTAAGDPPGAVSQLTEKYKDRFKLNIESIKSDAKAKIDFDPKDLQLVKTGEALKEKAQGLPALWDQRAKNLNVDERLKKAEDQLKAIRSTPTQGSEALSAIPASIKKLKETKAELDGLKKEILQVKSSASTDINEIKSGASGLSQAKKKDVDDLMSRLNLDFANPDRLVEGIIGPLVLQRFQMVFHYIQLARRHMPSRKEKETLPLRPRAKGMDIEFPTLAAPPTFWLMKAVLDGTYESTHASGSLSDLTSDPARVGRPFTVDLKGAQGSKTFSFQSVLDHTGEISKDSLAFQTTGAEVVLSLVGEENLGGQIKLTLPALKLDETSPVMRSIARAIEGMKEVTVNAQIYGTWKDPSLKISSNLSPVLSSVLKDSVANAAQDQRKQIEARLDQILADKQKEVEAKVAGLDGKLGQFADLEAKVQQKISEATGINLGDADGDSPIPGLKIPSLKGLFKK